MDSFSLIQHFFTQMQCPHCGHHLEEESVKLLREDDHMFLVHLECQHCHSDIGNAMIGIETNLQNILRHQSNASAIMIEVQEEDELEFQMGELNEQEEDRLSDLLENIRRSQKMPRFAGGTGSGSLRRRYQDPELTPQEKERLKPFDPIGYDDVLEAHHFFENLGRNWQEFIPAEMRQSHTACEGESHAEENAH